MFLNYGFQRKIEEIKLGLQDVLEGLKLSILGQFVSYLILVPEVFCLPSTDAKEKKNKLFLQCPNLTKKSKENKNLSDQVVDHA